MQKASASRVVVRLVRIQGIYAYQMGGMDEPAVPDIQAHVGDALLPVRSDSSEEEEIARPEIAVRGDIAGGDTCLQFADIHHIACENLLRGIPREEDSVKEIDSAGVPPHM